MDSMKQIKLMLPKSLVDRVEAAARREDVSRAQFFVGAALNELKRLELSAIREDIALLEIDRNILAEGQSVNVVAEGDLYGSDAAHSQCEMCHALLPLPEPNVDGPLFCRSCLGIAKGANLEGLER